MPIRYEPDEELRSKETLPVGSWKGSASEKIAPRGGEVKGPDAIRDGGLHDQVEGIKRETEQLYAALKGIELRLGAYLTPEEPQTAAKEETPASVFSPMGAWLLDHRRVLKSINEELCALTRRIEE